MFRMAEALGANATHSEILDTCQNVSALANRALNTLCHSYLGTHSITGQQIPAQEMTQHRPEAYLGIFLKLKQLINSCFSLGIWSLFCYFNQFVRLSWHWIYEIAQ